MLKRKLFILFFQLFWPFFPLFSKFPCCVALVPASGFPSQRPLSDARQRHVNDRKALICRWWSNGLGRGTFQTKNRGGGELNQGWSSRCGRLPVTYSITWLHTYIICNYLVHLHRWPGGVPVFFFWGFWFLKMSSQRNFGDKVSPFGWR